MQRYVVPLETVTYLVNEWGTTPRHEAAEEDRPLPTTASAFPSDAPHAWRRTTHAELRRLADDLHPVFAAPSPGEQAATLSALVRAYGLTLHLEAEGDEVVVGLEEPTGRTSFRAALVTSLLLHLTRRGPSRIGTCEAPRCADAWADPTGGRPRRFCSETCSGRARVASYRQRHRSPDRGRSRQR